LFAWQIKAGELFEKVKEDKKALECYKTGKSYRKAVELAIDDLNQKNNTFLIGAHYFGTKCKKTKHLHAQTRDILFLF
jgi:hypothetical protein